MQDSDKCNPNPSYHESPSYFDELLSYYHSIGWRPSLFYSRYTSLENIIGHRNKTIEETTKFINKIKSKKLACNSRANSIPENATIRREYVKCGKEFCEELHGPYYYAYWKETDISNRKLKKKYIGTFMPTKDDTKLLTNDDLQ